MASWVEELRERLALEELRRAFQRERPSFTPQQFEMKPEMGQELPPPPPSPWQPTIRPGREEELPQSTWTPQQPAFRLPSTSLPAPAKPPPIQPSPGEEVLPKGKPISVPFWQRALQIFVAPFEWVEENLIKPGLGVVGTGVGFVPEAERKPGEDFWEWKKRSWAGWESPGININVPWSNDDWRVNIKGVMEIAPWLLIPGAGQVGGGLRAARGIAGIAGRISRPLGYAIEYSPWGVVEKTAGVALRAGFRGVGKVTGGVSKRVSERLYGKIPEPEPPTPAISKLGKFFKESVIPAREALEKELPALRERQFKAVEDIWARVRKGEITATEGTALAEKATAGGIKAGFAVKGGQFTTKEVDEGLGKIIEASENGLVARDSALAFRDLVMTGALPEPHHIRDFAKVFGEDFAKAVGKFAQMPVSTKGQILDALNLPRAVLASGDLSATFRQGLILMLTRPQDAPRAFARQLKAFASEKLTLDMDDVLRNHSLYRNAVGDGVEFTAIRRGARMAAKEEPFASNLAQRLPFVRRSERAFTTYLNEMRMSAYEAAYGAMTAQGATPAQFKLLGSFINMASGRGTLPANLDRYAPVLNTVLFSARYQMSTLQLPKQLGRMLLSKNPYMRKEAAKALITFVGGGAALLGLLKSTGSKVEIDPRSGDFGKIVIGKTRLDIWRGYVQYARFVAQMLVGERKSAYGNMNKAQRGEIASRFLQSKVSPAFGLMVDLLKGESYMGEPLFNETTGFIKTARDRLLPLALQDVIDAMEQSGTNGLWTAAPATLGIGVLTYVNDLVRVKEKIAREMGYDTWDEIDPKTQREIQNGNTELQVAYIDFDRQVMGTAWGDWRNAGKAIEDNFREDVDKAVAQFRETKDGYNFREKISDSFTARRGGYASRGKMPQFEDIVRRLNIEDTAESLVSLGPEQLAIKVYSDALWGDDMYDEFGDYRFDEAELRKQQLRQQLGEEMFNYVEEYRGLKYEDFPPEYQELVRAKELMKPYWQVRDRVEKMFGKTFAESSFGQRLITKERQRLLLANSEMERFRQMFYVRE